MIKLVYIFSVLLVLFAFLAQGCMSFRITDEEAQKQFRAKGLDIITKTTTVGTRNIHYAMAGDNDKPTLIFVHGTPVAGMHSFNTCRIRNCLRSSG